MNKNRTLIIAEIGPNHNGSLSTAVKMIKKLAFSDVDVIKFQLGNPKSVYSDDAFKADYQKKNDHKKTILEMSKKFQLPKKSHKRLSNLCKNLGLKYACSAFDLKSLIYLDKVIKVPFFKIPSGEINSLDMLDYIAKKKKPILLSTGMSTFVEIKKALQRLTRYGNKKITILHCVSSYPAQDINLNLNIINELSKKFKTKVGYSDHSVSDLACIAAVAKGASVIEKHVTLSKSQSGPDHKASMTINGFKNLVKKIRKIETMLGSKTKKFSHDEINVKKMARKSIVTNRFIKKGSRLKISDITFKRPGIGISPLDIKKFLGKKLLKDKQKNKVLFAKELKK